jgi:hypothetical protein
MSGETGGNPPTAAADQDLFEACTAFFTADTLIRNESVLPNDDQAADRLDRYYLALGKVTATAALTADGRRMKATVALRAMQSVAGDLQPEERCGLSALVDLLMGGLTGELIGTDASVLKKINEELGDLASVIGILNHLMRSPHALTPSQWAFLVAKLHDCHANLDALSTATADTAEGLPAASPALGASVGNEDQRFLRRLLRNAARAAIETCDEAD